MPNKEFLENYSLYRKFRTQVPSQLNEIWRPAINVVCSKCESLQTFRQVNDWFELEEYKNAKTAGKVVRAQYVCSACHSDFRTFFIKFSGELDSMTKIGQWPAWSVDVDQSLAQMLGDHTSSYQKGLICESQSYGIGAFAYYRRIVEDVIDRLLDDIGDLISGEESDTYKKALAETKTTIVAQDKIALVKDLLPPILRPEGMNPLSLLHSTLSEGLHGRSDEDCLEDAQSIRTVLVFLVNQVMQAKASAKSFTVGMRKLLDRKSKS